MFFAQRLPLAPKARAWVYFQRLFLERLYFHDLVSISPILALEAVRAKTKDTIVGMKVAYDLYKLSRSVVYSKKSLCGIF